jgi:hypothetical protein
VPLRIETAIKPHAAAADIDTSMTISLSHPARVAVLAGTVVVIVGAAAGTMLISRGHSGTKTPAVPVTHSKPVHTARPHVNARPAKPTLALNPLLPIPLQNALRRSPLVVAVVVSPGDAADAQVLAQARIGAAKAHARVVPLNVLKDRVAGATATWMAGVTDPATLVVRRPGTIAVELDGYSDSMMVAQAVVDARQHR